MKECGNGGRAGPYSPARRLGNATRDSKSEWHHELNLDVPGYMVVCNTDGSSCKGG